MQILPIDLFTQELPSLLALIEALVTIESPSTDKSAVDLLGARIIQELEALHGEIHVYPHASSGNNILCRWGDGPDGILVMSHMDTVFDLGFLSVNPFRQEADRLYGPGVQDMKSSIAMLLTVLRLFQQRDLPPARPITAIFTSDEETGSYNSRALIEEEARRAAVVFCLEPALANGALKTARKGTGEISLRVKGVAAHAGGNHERGRNAIEELAHHVLSMQKLTDYNQGTTVNVGIVGGGTRTNVVPEDAFVQADLRITSMSEFHRLSQWVNNLTPVIEGTSLIAQIALNRPPMPRDETMLRTFRQAQAIGQALGLDLSEGSTGGASDANFVAPLGIPVLDGLGPIGDGAHSEREFIQISSLPARCALLAALLLNW